MRTRCSSREARAIGVLLTTLAIALAVAVAAADTSLPGDLVAIGEVGLAGEVRPVAALTARLTEAARLGFRQALVPAGHDVNVDGMHVMQVSDLGSALRALEAEPRVPRPAGGVRLEVVV